MTQNSKRRIRLVLRARARVSLHLKTYVATSVLSAFALAFIIFLNLYDSRQASAAANGDYRSKATGNWNSTSTWETYNGTSWVNASSTPSSTDGVITVLSGHTVTVNASVTVDQVVVSSGGTLTISSGTMTVANGTGSDVDVSGTANLNTGGTVSISSSAVITILSGGTWNYNGGTETTSAGWAINNGSTYVHGVNGVDVPTATWGSSSTLKITGVVNTDVDNLNQTLGNIIYDCPNQTANIDFKDKLASIAGDFTVVNTGSGRIKFDKSSTNQTLTISGNYSVTGGTVMQTNQGNWNISVAGNFSLSSGTYIMAGADGVPQLTILGNMTISGGTLDMSQYTGNTSSKGIGTINLSGNLTQSGGTITETSTGVGFGDIYFAKSGTQTFSLSGGSITNTINFTVNNGSILDAGNNIFTGAGTFTLASGGGIILANSNGISTSGATGNIQVTGTRTFSTGGNYTYSGSSAQITGSGLPSQVNNFTLNNSSGLTLTNSTIVASTLTFTSGNLTTNSNVITLGTAQSNTGTLSRTSGHVIGYIKRWFSSSNVSNILFPVGTDTYYEGANVSITTTPSGGTVTAHFADTVNAYLGMQIPDAGVMLDGVPNGYWQLTPGDGMAGGAFTLNLNANSIASIVTDYTQLRIIRKVQLSDPWTVLGTHSPGTGSNSAPVANRTGITSWNYFGISTPVGIPLPVELAFFNAQANGNSVQCKWQTASEVNNDFFTIERSPDGINFIPLETVSGAGNSNVTQSYSYIDSNPLSGTGYYRLQQTDFDGTSTYSKVLTIHALTTSAANEIDIGNIYPNPFSTTFTLSFNSPASMEITITLFDVNGKIVSERKVQAVKGINYIAYNDVAPLIQGNYFIKIFSDGKSDSKRLCKI
jgi:hypothetical protein